MGYTPVPMGTNPQRELRNLSGQWVPKEELLRLLRAVLPDPDLREDVKKLGGTLEQLRDPWPK